MSVVRWAHAVSGDWDTAANWSPADVPGPTTAVGIRAAAPGGKTYTITLTAPDSIAGLNLDSKSAELLDESALRAKRIAIQTGYLDVGAGSAGSKASLTGDATLSGGTLALHQGASFHGTLTQSGGTLIADNGTIFGTVIAEGTSGSFFTDSNADLAILDNVTWEGALNFYGGGTLAVVGSADFTGVGGMGAGDVTANHLLLKNVSSLDNATITLSGTYPPNDLVVKTPALTFGSALTIVNPGIDVGSSATTITNNGTLLGNDYGGTGVGDHGQLAGHAMFVNNGLIEDNFVDNVGSFTNNGVIEVFSSFSLAYFTAFGSFTNTGSIIVGSTGEFEAGSLTNAGTISVTGGLSTDGLLSNTGLIALTFSEAEISATTLQNDGTITSAGGTLHVAAVSGTGVIELGVSTSPGSTTADLDGAGSAGQTLALIGGQDTMNFGSISDAQLFAGLITGLDGSGLTDPRLIFDNATISNAYIAGSAIAIDFSNGASATLATGAQLGGSLSWEESGNNAILSYTRAGSAAHA